MLYFESRSKARAFAAKKAEYKTVDFGADVKFGNRWAVKVL